MRYRFIERHKKAFPVTLMCRVLKLTRSGYYTWRGRSLCRLRKENEQLSPLVQQIHRESGGTYGTRRMAKALQAHDVACGRARARTLMKFAGVSVERRKKFRVTTESKHNLPVSPNLLNRQFDVKEPNRVWASDITYVWTREGWLYLAAVMDLYSRQIVGWSMSSRITKRLVIDALHMAVWHRKPGWGLIFHSDRGSQYCSKAFQRLLKVQRMISSMSRKGDCWDNAVMERFFGSLKTERVASRRYRSRHEAKRDIVDYIEMFYNSKRRHSYLGYVSPREYERMRSLDFLQFCRHSSLPNEALSKS